MLDHLSCPLARVSFVETVQVFGFTTGNSGPVPFQHSFPATDIDIVGTCFGKVYVGEKLDNVHGPQAGVRFSFQICLASALSGYLFCCTSVNAALTVSIAMDTACGCFDS